MRGRNQLIISEKIKDRLYPAVLKLFSENDFHQVNLRSISKASGVSIGTIYKYFESKEDLLFKALNEYIYQKIIIDVETHLQGLESPKEIFRKMLWITMNAYDQCPELAITAIITVPLRTWMQYPHYRQDAFTNIINQILPKYHNDPEVDPAIDLRRFRDIYYMILYRYVQIWYYHGRKWRLVDAVSRDFEMLWKFFYSSGESP